MIFEGVCVYNILFNDHYSNINISFNSLFLKQFIIPQENICVNVVIFQ